MDMLAAMPDVGASSTPTPAPLPSEEVARAREAELVARCLQGDLHAFEAIYRQHSIALFSLALRMLGNQSDAEDLLQEIFLNAYRKLGSYQGRSALGTWLYRLAVNRCLDHLRSGASQKQSITWSLEEQANLDPSAPADGTTERLDLERAIVQLPHSYRAAFVLYDIEGFGHREVANILGVAEGTSKSLVHKARLKLRELLRSSRQESGNE